MMAMLCDFISLRRIERAGMLFVFVCVCVCVCLCVCVLSLFPHIENGSKKNVSYGCII